MRFTGRALLASAFVLGACAGGNNNTASTDTTATAATPAASSTDTGTAAAAAGSSSTAGATGTAAPATGKTVVVNMTMTDPSHPRFDPASVTVKQGDAIKWVLKSGAPHNIAFDSAKAPANVKAQLSANMPNQMQPLMGPLMMNPGDSYTVSFAKIPPGKYYYYCLPHGALGMNGTVTVQ